MTQNQNEIILNMSKNDDINDFQPKIISYHSSPRPVRLINLNQCPNQGRLSNLKPLENCLNPPKVPPRCISVGPVCKRNLFFKEDKSALPKPISKPPNELILIPKPPSETSLTSKKCTPRLRRYKIAFEESSTATSSVESNPQKKTNKEIEVLNQLCNQLLKEQDELRQQLKEQEDQIQFIRSSKEKNVRLRKEPLKLFQIAVSQLEKERKIRCINSSRSITPWRNGSQEKHRSPEVSQLPLALNLSFKNSQASNENSEELVTFRSRHLWSNQNSPKKQFRFPREIFSRHNRKTKEQS
ncbi:unnamed protein product [Blepharisma stoltei]|uniref:Uncharacterized protein n=1 Tax=Blepharisma stoltei TaxID=1481888 RepID=A0AAU9J1K0_9CILI|nr:unnamed protein product [Blepharisma stoltei]